jgi:hypothetical protein
MMTQGWTTMSNVKEGDLAVIVDPDGPNHGARVCVLGKYPKDTRPELIWWVQPLQLLTVSNDWAGGKRGDRVLIACIAPDRILRRIDPDGPEEVIVRKKELDCVE